MMSMFATLALAGKAENLIPDSVLLEGIAPSIANADFATCTCGISMSTWVEFVAPSPIHNTKSSEAWAETTFDPLDMLLKNSRHQTYTPVSSRQRHGHSLLLALGIHHMSDLDSESDAESDACSNVDAGDELRCSAMEAKDAKKVYADDPSQPSTNDTLPDQDRATTIESLTSYYNSSDVGTYDRFSTKDSLPSLSGFADNELEDEDEEEAQESTL